MNKNTYLIFALLFIFLLALQIFSLYLNHQEDIEHQNELKNLKRDIIVNRQFEYNDEIYEVKLLENKVIK